MAIVLEQFNLVIRRDCLQAFLPGGWAQFTAEYGVPLHGRVDGDLVSFTAQNASEIEDLNAHWTRRGLTPAPGLGGRSGDTGDCDMVVHRQDARSEIADCGWLAITDEGLASFAGTRHGVRRQRFGSPWSDELIALSQKYVMALLATPPNQRAPLPLKHWDDRFALLEVDMQSREGLVAKDRETGVRYCFRLVEELLDAGWAVD